LNNKSGDPCTRKACGGRLHVYCSRSSTDGEFRTKYLRCRKCGTTAGCGVEGCSTIPRGCSTAGSTSAERDGKIDHMDTTGTSIQFDLLTLWEAGMFVGLDPMDVLARAEDGLFPSPCSNWPLRWAELDVGRWWLAKQNEGKLV